MFQPNSPQWVTIVVTFVFATFLAIASVQVSAFVAVTGALIVWWLEGRRQKRNELQHRTEAPAGFKSGASVFDMDLRKAVPLRHRRPPYDIDTDVPTKDLLNWLRNAAEQGYAPAQFDLGVAYASGRGVPQDYVEAHKWTNLSASRFNDREQADDREEAVESRDALAALMDPRASCRGAATRDRVASGL